ncbi:MAG TPA: hypothetical protein DHN33_08100 [Eubacteriaceae bacterium]|nr:hypothetical protein [Eubacteriaceae bacterium]
MDNSRKSIAGIGFLFFLAVLSITFFIAHYCLYFMDASYAYLLRYLEQVPYHLTIKGVLLIPFVFFVQRKPNYIKTLLMIVCLNGFAYLFFYLSFESTEKLTSLLLFNLVFDTICLSVGVNLFFSEKRVKKWIKQDPQFQKILSLSKESQQLLKGIKKGKNSVKTLAAETKVEKNPKNSLERESESPPLTSNILYFYNEGFSKEEIKNWVKTPNQKSFVDLGEKMESREKEEPIPFSTDKDSVLLVTLDPLRMKEEKDYGIRIMQEVYRIFHDLSDKRLKRILIVLLKNEESAQVVDCLEALVGGFSERNPSPLWMVETDRQDFNHGRSAIEKGLDAMNKQSRQGGLKQTLKIVSVGKEGLEMVTPARKIDFFIAGKIIDRAKQWSREEKNNIDLWQELTK